MLKANLNKADGIIVSFLIFILQDLLGTGIVALEGHSILFKKENTFYL